MAEITPTQLDVTLEPHESTPLEPTVPDSHRLFRFIHLPISITRVHLLSFLIACFLSILLIVFLDATQSFLLTNLIRIPADQLGRTSGDLAFYDQLIGLPAGFVWGTVSDSIGRPLVWTSGFVIAGASLILYIVPRDVYPGLLLVRLLFALGATSGTAMLTATLADYSVKRSRGVLAGLTGLCAGAGALVAVFGLVRLPPRLGKDGDATYGITATYIGVGIVTILIGIGLWFTLKKEPVHHAEESEPGPKSSWWQVALDAVKACSDARILLGLAGGFMARSLSVTISLFIPLLVNQYYLSHDLCPALTAVDVSTDILKASCKEAYDHASSLTGVAQVATLFGAMLFGIGTDRSTPVHAVILSSLLALVGSFGFLFYPDPRQGIVFLFAVFLGLGQIGAVVSSLPLVSAEWVDSRVRGGVAGVYSFTGAAGVMILSKAGGTWFDSFAQAPFVLLIIVEAIVLLMAIWVIVWSRFVVDKNKVVTEVEQGQCPVTGLTSAP